MSLTLVNQNCCRRFGEDGLVNSFSKLFEVIVVQMDGDTVEITCNTTTFEIISYWVSHFPNGRGGKEISSADINPTIIKANVNHISYRNVF